MKESNKYILVCWHDGEFDMPVFFNTEEEAIKYWHNDIAEYADIPLEAIQNAYNGDGDFSDWVDSIHHHGEGYFCGSDCATVHLDFTFCDWQLFCIE